MKIVAECECGKSELTEEEIKEGKENGFIICNKCFAQKCVENFFIKIRSKELDYRRLKRGR